MAKIILDLAVSVDCRAAALALAAGEVSMGRELLARAALLLRIRASEEKLVDETATIREC